LAKAEATHNIPFHFDEVVLIANVDIDAGLIWLKVRRFGQVRLLVLMFNGIVGQAPIDIFTINTDTHRPNLRIMVILKIKLILKNQAGKFK
jgi:hypothetical protein